MLEKRLSEIGVLLAEIETRATDRIKRAETAEGSDLEAMNAETKADEVRKAELLAEQAEIRSKLEAAKAVANGAGKEVKNKEDKTMPDKEFRNSEPYINAFAEYIKTGDAREVRAIITENGTAGEDDTTVPVPTFLSDIINTAYDEMPILSRVRRTTLRGNVKVGFEVSATDAAIHEEGAEAPDEEKLVLGIVTMIPETIKKWITFSDEALDMKGRDFLEYVYRELAYKIFHFAEDEVVAKIINSPATSTLTAPGVPVVAAAGLTDIINAVAKLSDEARDPVVIMNKASYAYYKGLAIAANYALDPFDGLTVLFNNTLDVADGTTAGNVAIVGDLNGVQANFPMGTDVAFKYDDLSLAEKDLIKVVARLMVAIAVVAPGRFAVVAQAEETADDGNGEG